MLSTTRASKTPLLDAVRRSCEAQGLEVPRFEAAAETVEQRIADLAEAGYCLDQIAHAVALDGICGAVSERA